MMPTLKGTRAAAAAALLSLNMDHPKSNSTWGDTQRMYSVNDIPDGTGQRLRK
jgi:hypothetical protein